ncbi:MAG: TolC family protein [bacterium]|nr:TolC family protein [bacterium]
MAQLDDDNLRRLAAEVLDRNPGVARLRARAAAAAAKAPQVRALPDPVATLAWFVLPPETRVGPQRLRASISQKLPWFGKLALKEQAALYGAAAVAAEVEARRLTVVTEVRRLFHELAFVDEHAVIVREQRENFIRHEENARARYSAGMGLQQEVIRIQAEITRTEVRLLEIEARRKSLLAALNALRDRPADLEIGSLSGHQPRERVPDAGELRRQAVARRPELAAADAGIARNEVLVELAGKNFKPDFTLGLGYTLVDRRDDAPGRSNPPPDDGEDVLGLSVGVNLPVWRRKLEAGLEEALRMQSAAEERKRELLAGIEASLGDVAARLPLLFQEWELFELVLLAQAEEALSSAETAYITGKLNAVDLLDAEDVLFKVRTTAARTRADHAVAWAQLEGAAGGVVTPAGVSTPKED